MNDQIVNPHTSLNLHVKSFAMLPLCWKITFVEKGAHGVEMGFLVEYLH